jgi:glycosidase
VEGLKLAYTFLVTARGTPLVYYGDEIALPGGGDPDNRRDFPGGFAGDPRNAFTAAGRTSDQQAVWAHLQALLRLRAARPDLRNASTTHLQVEDQLYVYRRGQTIVAINNDARSVEVRLPGTQLPDDALGICARATRAGNTMVVTVPARSGCVF